MRVAVDLTTVDSGNYTEGPSGTDEVMCLTCHRAHASAFADATRWDMSETFLADSHPATTDIDFVQADVDNKYYTYTFDPDQRSLCNKCHAKDRGDRGTKVLTSATTGFTASGDTKFPSRYRP